MEFVSIQVVRHGFSAYCLVGVFPLDCAFSAQKWRCISAQ